MLRWLSTQIPTRRELTAFVLAFTMAGVVFWVAGANSVSRSAGDAIHFFEGRIYAPTVRDPATTTLDRMARGLKRIADPLIVEHPATDNGDQAEIRHRSLLAAEAFYGARLVAPASATKANRVNGGSSGLAWAIAALALQQPNLVDDKVVAASAVLESSGWTVNVGGLEFKTRTSEMSSTDMLFVNSDQASETRAMLLGERGPVVIGVDSLAQAIGVLCATGPRGVVCDRYRELAETSDNEALTVQLSPVDRGVCVALLRYAQDLRCRIVNNIPVLSSARVK